MSTIDIDAIIAGVGDEPPDDWADKFLDTPEGQALQASAYRMPDDQPAADPIEMPAEWVPFPVDELPPVMGDFIREAERAIQIDAAFVALPLLASAGAAIGNSNQILLKAGFTQPALVWNATVATSGDGKTPGLDAAVKHVRNRQSRLLTEYQANLAEYQKAKASHEALSKAERAEQTEPTPPTMEHNIISDTTCEATCVRLMQSPRGLINIQDELATIFNGMNQYKSSGTDRETYLGYYNAGFTKTDRKTSMVGTMIVRHAFVAITGGIQPRILAEILNGDHVESGMTPRFQFVMPPSRRRTWSEDVISDEAEQAIATMFDSLYALPLAFEDGDVRPNTLPLSAEARRIWGNWFNEVEAAIGGMVDRESAYAIAMPKIRSVAARIALIMQLVSYVTGENRAAGNHIDATSMQRGVNIARWFMREQARVYRILAMAKGDREMLKQRDMIRDMGGRVTVRDWQRRRHLSTSDAAEVELCKLVEAKIGEWAYTQHPNGGRPSKMLTLCDNTPVSDA